MTPFRTLLLLLIFSQALCAQIPTYKLFPTSGVVKETRRNGHFLYINHGGYILTTNLLTGTRTYHHADIDSLPQYEIDVVGGDTLGNVCFITDTTLYVKTSGQWIAHPMPAGSQNQSRDIEYLDPSNIWIANSGGVYGVAKFDGIGWTTYSTSNSLLPTNSVNDLEFDTAGTLWMATMNGLVHYDWTNWTTYNTSNSQIPSNIALNLFIDPSDNKWVGTFNNGAGKFDGTTWTRYASTNSGLIYDQVNDISMDANGVYYFGTEEGLSIKNGITWTSYVNEIMWGASNKWVNSCAAWGNSVYVGTVFGVLIYDGVFHRYCGTFPKYSGLYIDSTGQKVFCTPTQKSVSIFDGSSLNSFVTYDSASVISDSMVNSFQWMVDSMGTKWWREQINPPLIVNAGLHAHTSTSDTVYTTTNSGLPHNTVFDFIVDTLNRKWMGTQSGVACFNDTSWTVYNTSNSALTANPTYDLELDRFDNSIWVANSNGIAHFDGTIWTNYDNTNSPLPVFWGNESLLMDKCNKLWIGTRFGLYTLDTAMNWVVYDTLNSGLSDPDIRELKFDQFNKLWIGTAHDLCSFNGAVWETFTFPFANSNNSQILVDKSNNKWVYISGYDWFVINEHGILNSALNPVYGHVFYDANQNGIDDSSDYPMQGMKIILLPDSLISFTDNNGDYYFNYSGGSDTIVFATDTLWTLTSDSLYYVIDSIADIVGSHDFGFFQADTVYASEFSFVTTNRARCDRPIVQWNVVRNNGNMPLDGTVRMRLDPLLGLDFAFPVEDSLYASGDTISWNYSGLLPSHEFCAQAGIIFPGATYIGDTLPEFGDHYQLVNSLLQFQETDTAAVVVTCSYHPNEKLSYPSGDSTVSHFTPLLPLNTFTYTINFQNTGNDTAYNVLIIDTLDVDFNLNSFDYLCSSHGVSISINPATRTIQFLFSLIYLVDSTTNEPLSHGFVQFRITTVSALSDSSVIANTAYIYFDGNVPVITNAVINTLVLPGPNTIESNQQLSAITVWPTLIGDGSNTLRFTNPDHVNYEVSLCDYSGRVIQIQNTSDQHIFLPSVLNNGMYILRFRSPVDGSDFIVKIVVAK